MPGESYDIFFLFCDVAVCPLLPAILLPLRSRPFFPLLSVRPSSLPTSHFPLIHSTNAHSTAVITDGNLRP